MELVAIVTALALLEYFVFGILAGRARGRAGVPAPAMTGDPTFERYTRVHQNTLEQLAIFLPSIWLFATYVDARIAAGLGLLFIVGRGFYLRLYVQDPETRGPGAAITSLAQIVLLLGGGIGAIRALL